MTATNHTLTGAIIGASIANPLALPLAFLSHFVLDVLPHYGNSKIGLNKFNRMLFTDITLAFLVLLTLVIFRPDNWFLVASAGVLAASPDLLSIPRWLAKLKGQKYKYNKLTRFLKRIQWGERPWGMAIEIPFGVIMGLVLLLLLV